MTTLWSVENEPIYELTKLFYNELDKGYSLDIALQNAQNEWLTTATKSDQLPYAWAGMVLVGNAEPVDMGMSRMVGYVLIGIVIVLTVFTINFFSRRRKLSLAKSM